MSKITIVGVGALGSHVVQFIRNVDWEIAVIDFDRIEAKNLKSQFHGLPNNGNMKIDGLQRTMQFLWGVKITRLSSKLVPNNAQVLLHNTNLVVDCLDNGASRRVIQEHVQAHNIPCVHAGLAADGSFARVCWDESFVIDEEDGVGQPTCENGEHLPFIALTSSYLAMAITEFLRSGKKVGFQISPAGTFRF